MATKDFCSKEKAFVNICNKNVQQFTNLNLNQTQKFTKDVSSIVQFNNKSSDDKEYDSPISSFSSKNEEKSFNKSSSMINALCSNISNSLILKDEKKVNKKHNSSNNSTLSLHIAAYENSAPENSDAASFNENEIKSPKADALKKWKTTKQLFASNSKSNIQSSFEFPRQQKGGKISSLPEVMQFKASQQLLNLNSSNQQDLKMTKVVKSTKKTSIKSKTTEKEDPTSQFAPEIGEFFKTTLGFKDFTPVQQCAVKYFLTNYDCIVQAPTGSGKTLAYVLPMMQILKNKCEPIKDGDKPKICALVLVPTRDLVGQVASVIKPVAAALSFQLVAFCSAHKQAEEKKIKGNCIIVSTPGRFANLIEKMPDIKNYVKSLEMLVIDEADRFIDVDLKSATTSILAILPKQRRSGLFSATQAKEMEDLIKFGLRNPVRLEVTGDSDTFVDAKTNTEAKTAAPSTLENSFVVIPASFKVHGLIEILKKNADKKVLVFFSSRFSVIYFERIIKLLMGDSRKIINTHGKKFNRTKAIQEFSKAKNPIMLATDVAGRGLDLENVDIVIQFDLPKYSSWFVHRIGRAGRIGKAGTSILLLTPEEEAYAEFLENHENIKLTKSDLLDDIIERDALKTRDKIVKLASTEREFLELGTNAFVAMINAYLSHDCQIVCKVWDLDIGNLANAFGLLRMPKISEIKKVDISAFERVDIETSTIPYKDKENEAARQEKLAGQEGRRPRFQTKGKRRKHRSDKDPGHVDGEENNDGGGGGEESGRPQKRKKMNEWEELQTEQRLLKKFKKGKLSKDQLNDAMDEI